MVLEPKFIDYVKNDSDSMAVLADIAKDGQLSAYPHQRLLAVHGHHSRQDAPRRRVACLEGLGMSSSAHSATRRRPPVESAGRASSS